MARRFFTQSQWFGIEFDSLGLPLDASKLPAQGFYERFYAELGRRFPNAADLPEAWRMNKREGAAAIAAILDPGSRVLSFGSGIGYIEQCLINDYGFESIMLFDTAHASDRYFPELAERYWDPDSSAEREATGSHFDAAYLSQVLYALDDAECISTLAGIRSWLSPGGLVISLDTSLVARENAPAQETSIRHPLDGVAATFSRTANAIRMKLRNLHAPPVEQGWGWQRDNGAVARLFEQAGYGYVKQFCAAGQAISVARIR